MLKTIDVTNANPSEFWTNKKQGKIYSEGWICNGGQRLLWSCLHVDLDQNFTQIYNLFYKEKYGLKGNIVVYNCITFIEIC